MAPQGEFGRMSVVARVGEEPTRAGVVQGGAAGTFVPAAEKYEVEGPIGGGGMGEVMLVSDRDLKRQVAMKVLRQEIAASPEQRVKFVAEAQATSQLEHPGIPPVHDIGIAPSGQVYFTMKLVRGRTLSEVLKDLFLGVRAVRRQYNLHKLVSVLERITEALHFAHERGVIHRDLKPDNVMLGDFGEVHVMDWGIAKVSAEEDEYDDEFGDPESIATAGTDVLATQAGTIKGTIPYMSPEQARGEPLDRRSDVYALGCLLYEVLTLHAAYEGQGMGLLARVRKGDFPPVEGRNPKRPPPPPLADLCTRAMALSVDDRPATARAFGDELRSWLDGRAERARKHKEAEALAVQGKEAAARYRRLKDEVVQAEETAEEEAGKYKPWQPVSEKRSAIEARKRVEDLHAEVALAFADTTHTLNAALLAEEDNPTARAALADLWRERLVEAEGAGKRPDVVHAEAMVRRYDDGRLAGFLAGDGTLTLTSDPPGADVLLYRFDEQDGVLTPVDERSLGVTPLTEITLPMGSYLCILRVEGFRDVRYPVHISRNREWRGSVRMLTDEQIGEGFVYVPGGPFVYGEGQRTTEKDAADFVIQKFPVTFGEWGEFLAAVEQQAGLDAATELLPRTQTEGALMERTEDGAYRPVESLIDGPVRERYERDYGADFLVRVPVVAVTWHDAKAYCAWRTRTTGR